MSNLAEKTLLKEIDNLERALPDMKQLSALEPELAKIRDAKKKIQAELDIVKRFIEDKEDTISDVKQAS
jgi:predicted  nucleic acid-binding Zn-ribbon protein